MVVGERYAMEKVAKLVFFSATRSGEQREGVWIDQSLEERSYSVALYYGDYDRLVREGMDRSSFERTGIIYG